MAIDVVTMFRALAELEEEFLGKGRTWTHTTTDQKIIFELYRRYMPALSRLTRIKSKASTDWQVLNDFLVADNFDPMFNGPLDGIGAVSILDMLVNWLVEAGICNILGNDSAKHIGFEIPAHGRQVYTPTGFKSPLVGLETKSGDLLWLAIPDQVPVDLVDMIRIAFTAMSRPSVISRRQSPDVITTVQVPEVKFDVKPDIAPLLVSAFTFDEARSRWYIDQAMQQFKFAMNKEGARAKVATGIAMRKGISLNEPKPLVLNQPFMGWFTQPGAPTLPIAIFYADYGSWQAAGDLRSL